MVRRQWHTAVFVGLGVFLVVWSVLLYWFGAEQLVSFIGVERGYALMFLVAVFGGLSTVTAPAFFATLITLAVGGLNPLLLGVVTGAGMTISDSLFFYFGIAGREVASEFWGRQITRLSRFAAGKPRWVPQLIVYLYTAFTPLPNDILMLAAAFARVRYRDIVWFVFLGNATLSTLIASAVRAAGG